MSPIELSYTGEDSTNDVTCRRPNSTMGTPRERDEESEAVDDHLRERGGISIPCSPRALVCGKYQGTGFSFHFRRRCDEGTYLQFDLAQDNMDLISVVLDMTYPYGLTKDKEKPYEGILRQTLVSHENSCHTWIGFGYVAGTSTDYVDCAEHTFPSSVGYGYHSEDCAKNVSGEWNWCTGGPTCGKKVWLFQLTVFETDSGHLGQEKLTLELTYILFNKDERGRQKFEIMVAINGEVKGFAKSVDKRDAALGHYEKDRLKKSAMMMVNCKRDRVRGLAHPQHIPAYLGKVYQAPEKFTGSPRTEGEENQQEAMLRCLLQLMNACEEFNMSLLMRVLHDQLDDEATQWPFISGMNTLLIGQTGSVANILRHLSAVPRVKAPESRPHILILLLRLLTSVQHTIESGKWEKEIRCFSEKLFLMWTTWITVTPCRICEQAPAPKISRHLPNIVLQCNQIGDPLNIEEFLKRWTEDTNKKLADCDRNLRCRYFFHYMETMVIIDLVPGTPEEEGGRKLIEKFVVKGG